MSESILKEKSFPFAIKIVKLYKSLKENQQEDVLSKQLLRCGTSVGAMVREAKNSENRADFHTNRELPKKNVMKPAIGLNS